MRSGPPSRVAVLGTVLVVALALGHRGEIRGRAEAGLGRDMPAREAALARGFVLGEDEGVDQATVEDFRRSGLAHLLAVSGQNVALLALLAMPLLAALGMPLKTRLVWVLGLVAVYVPLAGAGPSIVRAGVMGGLSVLATLAGRRAPRLYALAVAAVVTLAIDPRIAADVGWQLSFAAVLGILALARPLRAAIAARLGPGRLRGALAEGAALTVAATLATAPLIAFHFEGLSTTTLVANLLALPAVAPAMWLGMIVAVGAQIPGFPVAALNAVEAPLLAYIAQVATWCGRPGWAYAHVRLGPGGLAASYATLAAVAAGTPVVLRRRRLARARAARAIKAAGRVTRCSSISSATRYTAGQQRLPGAGVTPSSSISSAARYTRRSRRGRVVGGAVALVAVLALISLPGRGGVEAAAPVGGLRISVLDVGQGDAILLQPARAPAVLVDGGPPGDDLAAKLGAAGVRRLGLAVVTHEQSDHAGGIEQLLGRFPVSRLAYARLSRRLRGEARATGAEPVRVAAGGSLRSGRLRLEVLWPPRALLAEPPGGADPNAQALVLLARWRDFSMLLTADAEAEAVPLDPGPVDVLKVAHHGSEDAGLSALLDRIDPQLAVISVGARNPFGHPTAETLATLAGHRVPTLRTDRDGTIVLDVRRHSIEVHAGA
jgi:competence protein ComEC